MLFPDINVWLAVASSIHFHHEQAKEWFQSLGDEELAFCRFTQLGLLRLLTTEAVMKADVLTQSQAWQVYDTFVKDGGARFMNEPRTIEESFRRLSRLATPSPKYWGDSYLAAFAMESGARLVTFDKGLAGRVRGAVAL